MGPPRTLGGGKEKGGGKRILGYKPNHRLAVCMTTSLISDGRKKWRRNKGNQFAEKGGQRCVKTGKWVEAWGKIITRMFGGGGVLICDVKDWERKMGV